MSLNTFTMKGAVVAILFSSKLNKQVVFINIIYYTVNQPKKRQSERRFKKRFEKPDDFFPFACDGRVFKSNDFWGVHPVPRRLMVFAVRPRGGPI